MIPLVLNHLWQSTLVAGLAALLTLLLRNNGAGVRFGLWFAASMKFLLPFSLLTMLGALLPAHPAYQRAAPLVAQMQPAAEPFTAAEPIAGVMPAVVSSSAGAIGWNEILLAVWLAGSVCLLLLWAIKFARLIAIARKAVPLSMAAEIAVRSSPALMEPGLVGIWRPVLLLPEGIEARLSQAEMTAIVAHEMSHARRRDNLTAAIHMLVQAVFWFYPLVWWIGRRLVAEREQACDEAVVAHGNDPGIYAESILKVCKYYLRSPLDCASGVSGADLKKRVEAIMENRFVNVLGRAKKILLACAAVTAMGIPVAAGMVAPPAQFAAMPGTPSPGTEAALRHQIEAWERHQPDFGQLASPRAALPALLQPVRVQRDIDSWGALASIRFEGVSPENWDIYSVAFEHQLTVWQITPLRPDGKIEGMSYTKAFARSDRTRTSPGTEAALRHQLEGWMRRDPPMDNVTPTIAAIDREQQPVLQTYFDGWGPMKSLKFTGVDVYGLDTYVAQFAHDRGIFTVGPLTPEGKITSWAITRAFDRSGDGPSPGTQASVRRYIESMQRGAPNYDEMLPMVAGAVRTQLPSLLVQFREWGKLQSVTFKSVSPTGMDVYDVAFAHGRAVWRIAPLTADGKVQMRGFAVVGDRGDVS